MVPVQPDFLTAFGMTALSAFAMAWLMWMLGRPHWHQGVAQAVAAQIIFGLAYACFSIQTQVHGVTFQVMSKTLIAIGIATFTWAILRFQQRTEHWRPLVVVSMPLMASLLLAWGLLPQKMAAYNRIQSVVTLVQVFYLIYLLLGMRRNTPGAGRVVVTVVAFLQASTIAMLVFSAERPSPDFASQAPLGNILAMWTICLILFLNLQANSIGFLMMLRDRQRALDDHRARRDPLTELSNRAALVEGLQMLIAQAGMMRRPVAMLMIDIDHFKALNDQHGHLVGDQAIKLVARMLQQQSRETDLVARYGGEEFVVALPDTGEDLARVVANRLCDALRQATLELSCGKELRITASIGVYVGVPEAGTAWQAMLGAADVAMYQAKRDGRDRVVLHVDR